MKPKTDRGRPVYYPWDKWFKVGSKHTLKRGRDFNCTSRTLVGYLYTRASRAGMKIRVEQSRDGIITLEVIGKAA